MVAAQTLCAALPLALAAFALEGSPFNARWSARAVGALLYLSLASSVVAFWLNYWLLKRVTATTVLAMGLVQPLIAAALGALILGERFGTTAALGGAGILISAAIILRKEG
jgi:drug/metabolite transporter (DMT)-like permease